MRFPFGPEGREGRSHSKSRREGTSWPRQQPGQRKYEMSQYEQRAAGSLLWLGAVIIEQHRWTIREAGAGSYGEFGLYSVFSRILSRGTTWSKYVSVILGIWDVKLKIYFTYNSVALPGLLYLWFGYGNLSVIYINIGFNAMGMDEVTLGEGSRKREDTWNWENVVTKTIEQRISRKRGLTENNFEKVNVRGVDWIHQGVGHKEPCTEHFQWCGEMAARLEWVENTLGNVGHSFKNFP